MKKIVLGLATFTCLTCLAGPAARAADPPEPASEEAPPPPPPPPRAALAELGVFIVPWGDAYVRSALGASFRYEAPLIRKPGILWDTTTVAVGVRDIYGYVNNSLQPYVEITPIAFFKVQASFGYETFIRAPFDGGVRVLTPLGEQRLAAGQLERNNRDAVDWAGFGGEGVAINNRDNFTAPVFGQGFRPRLAPTLQAKLGPIAVQYNFTVDWSFFYGGGHGRDAIVHDTFAFTLRKMHDVGFTHEGILVFDVPGVKDTIRIGAVARHYRVQGTGLERLETVGLLYYRPGSPWIGDSGTPWFAGQFGTNPVDPMHPWDFNWVLALGLDFRLL